MPHTAAAPTFVQVHQPQHQQVRDELAAGLLASSAHISPKFLYDALGSRLFDAITELPEYYPTRTEAAIFDAHAPAMARHVPAQAVWVDLGAGCCAKAAKLFAPMATAAYVAVDISADHLQGSLHTVQQRHPLLPMLGLGLDFSSELAFPATAQAWLQAQGMAQQPRVVFYPGSSIGNFARTEALALLKQAHAVCAEGPPGGGLLIGVDRVKPTAVLEPAYDDALGVTAAFNRNLLLHVNRLLGTQFDPAQWAHEAGYNQAESRIEMHLRPRTPQTVRWPGQERHFSTRERLHTENSYKWTPAAFEALLHEAGFGHCQHWTDTQNWFSVFWANA